MGKVNRLATLAVGLSVCAAVNAQVKIESPIEQGRRMVYDVAFGMTSEQPQAQSTDELHQTARIVFDVVRVDEDGGATVSADFDWIVIDATRAGYRTRVNSRDELGDVANPAEGVVRELVGQYTDAELTLRLAPNGEVVAVEGFEDLEAFITENAGTLPRFAAGVLRADRLGEALEPIWRCDGAVGRAVFKGDVWGWARESDMGPGMRLSFESEYAVEKAGDEEVRMVADVDPVVEYPQGREESAPRVEARDASGTIEAVWDVGVGALRSREAEVAYTLAVTLGEMEQTSRRTASTSFTLAE